VDEYVHGWRWTQHRNASSIHCQNYGRVSWYWLLESFCYSVCCHTVFSTFIWNQNIAVWTVMKVRFRIQKRNGAKHIRVQLKGITLLINAALAVDDLTVQIPINTNIFILYYIAG
jgi:hypothetical protein